MFLCLSNIRNFHLNTNELDPTPACYLLINDENPSFMVTIQRVSLAGYYRVGATPTSRFEAFGRDVGIAPTRHFHSNQLMLNSYVL